jgi:hypothetical protein
VCGGALALVLPCSGRNPLELILRPALAHGSPITGVNPCGTLVRQRGSLKSGQRVRESRAAFVLLVGPDLSTMLIRPMI